MIASNKRLRFYSAQNRIEEQQQQQNVIIKQQKGRKFNVDVKRNADKTTSFVLLSLFLNI